MSSTLRAAWNEVHRQKSWTEVRSAIVPLMPMPGSGEFDDDALFKNLEIFPGVFVRDAKWPFPANWGPNPDLTVNQNLAFNFDVELGNNSNLLDSQNASKILSAKRLLYLVIFQPFTRPLSLSSYRHYRETIVGMLRWLETEGSPRGKSQFADLNDYVALAECINSLNKGIRKTIPRIYVLLRWWRSRSQSSYTFFVPPPTIDAVNSSAEFNPENIRDDGDSEDPRLWQPLPDAFVAEAGLIWLDYAETILPILLKVLLNLRKKVKSNRAALRLIAVEVLSDVEWPSVSFPFKAPKSLRSLISVASNCQLSVIQLLSLAIGPRWAEVKGMPNRSVTRKRLDGQDQFILDARTFKFSDVIRGSDHHWPIANRLGTILETQARLARCVNGEDWPHLWAGFSRPLFGSKRALLQIDPPLKRFARRHNLLRHLGDSNYHHHRFRKTVARLVVIALNGGPMILRELFGHETLAMTMRYILANPELREDLRLVAEMENESIARDFMSREESLRGGGAEYFREVLRRAREEISVFIPEGKKDQEELTIEDLIDFISSEPEGIQIKQVLPGVVGCVKPLSENGYCTRSGELPDIALCSKSCRWNLLMDEGGKDIARGALRDALANIKATNGRLVKQFWRRIISDWITEYPELKSEFRGELARVTKSYGNRKRNKKKG